MRIDVPSSTSLGLLARAPGLIPEWRVGSVVEAVAVRDAVISISIPVIEIHLSNPAAREPFRRQNLLEDVVYAGIRGFGVDSYRLALEGLAARLNT